jgi:hypothetical protein
MFFKCKNCKRKRQCRKDRQKFAAFFLKGFLKETITSCNGLKPQATLLHIYGRQRQRWLVVLPGEREKGDAMLYNVYLLITHEIYPNVQNIHIARCVRQLKVGCFNMLPIVLGKTSVLKCCKCPRHRVGRVLSFSPVVGIGTPPTPHSQASAPPPLFGSGGRATLAGERGGGRIPIPTRGHTLCIAPA